MRFGRTAGIVVAIGLAVAMMAGLGYALLPLYGYSYSENNTTGLAQKSVDILVDNGEGYEPLSANMIFPAYDGGVAEHAISGNYAVAIKEGNADATGYVRLWCKMGHDSSWALIERMYVVFQGDSTEYDFGMITNNNQVRSGVPTAAVQLTGQTPFTIYIEYKDFGFTVDDNDDVLSEFAGSKFVFAFDDTDPFS